MITSLNVAGPLQATHLDGAVLQWQSANETGWSPRCRTTRWSVVLAAAAGGASARLALSRLYRAYWYPVFALFAKRRGRQAAAELTQAFFVERLVDKGDLKKVSQQPGKRFRGWLFTAAHRFLLNEEQFERRERRDVRRTVAFASEGANAEPGPRVSAMADTELDPEQRLGREQALRLLSTVLRRLRREYCANAAAAGVNGELRFDAVKVFLPGRDTDTAGYREVAQSLGLGGDAMKQLVCRLRKRFSDLLDEELTKRVKGDGDLPTAKRLLCQALASSAEVRSTGATRVEA